MLRVVTYIHGMNLSGAIKSLLRENAGLRVCAAPTGTPRYPWLCCVTGQAQEFVNLTGPEDLAADIQIEVQGIRSAR